MSKLAAYEAVRINWSHFRINTWNTRLLVLNVMEHCARRLGLDISDDEIADKLYWICCDLENWPEGEGFGSSDHYSYVLSARKEFGIEEN